MPRYVLSVTWETHGGLPINNPKFKNTCGTWWLDNFLDSNFGFRIKSEAQLCPLIKNDSQGIFIFLARVPNSDDKNCQFLTFKVNFPCQKYPNLSISFHWRIPFQGHTFCYWLFWTLQFSKYFFSKIMSFSHQLNFELSQEIWKCLLRVIFDQRPKLIWCETWNLNLKSFLIMA